MVKFLSQLSEIDRSDKAINDLNREYEICRIKLNRNQSTDPLYPEFTPTFDFWSALSDQKSRMKKYIHGNEKWVK